MFTKLFHQRIVLGFACSSLWLAQTGVSAAPLNDTCAGAVVIPTAGPFPHYTAITDLNDATTNADPAPPMIGDCTCGALTRVIWYKFTPASTRLFTISCSGDTATTVQDTYMAIYTSSGGCGGSFSSVDCDDDAGDLQSAISTTLSSNVTYYILVGVSCYSGPLGNNTMVQLRVTQPVAPTNDVCSGAELIPGAGPFPYLTSVTDTTLATTSADPPAPSCWSDHIRSVWYRFTPDATTTYQLSLCTNTTTTVYETVLAIYTSASGCGGPITQISCNHTNPCSDKLRSALTLTLTNGVAYFILAWEGVTYLPSEQNYIPGETDLQLRVARFLPPGVISAPASSITSTGAVLNAAINPNGLATTAWFEWGATTNYGNTTTAQSLGSGTSSSSISATVSGLSAGVTYHFRAKATNSFGMTPGPDRNFVWNSAPPALTSFMRQPDGTFVLQFTGQATQTYLIQASTNLINWITLGTATDNGDGSFTFQDPAATSLPTRFYRVLAP